MDYRTSRALDRLHQRDPDLADILTELLEMMAERKVPQAPRFDLSKLAQPQALLYIGGGIALLMQAPLPVVIDWIKAIAPLLSP
jgi:hypothetical protein